MISVMNTSSYYMISVSCGSRYYSIINNNKSRWCCCNMFRSTVYNSNNTNRKMLLSPVVDRTIRTRNLYNQSIFTLKRQQHRQQQVQVRSSLQQRRKLTNSTNTNNNNNTLQKDQQDQQQQVIIDTMKQKAAYAHYGKQRGIKIKKKKNQSTILTRMYQGIFGMNSTASSTSSSSSSTSSSTTTTLLQRNMNTAWYAFAIAIGALGASYAAVPLYKVFCQTTGFGGTTQRVLIQNNNNDLTNNENEYNNTFEIYLQKIASNILPSNSGARVHTWTDADAIERLRQLKPMSNVDMITIRFDTTVIDSMPWSFVPIQLDVKVVPGETALSFFRVTNHSNHAITGVATYNVYPPKVGIYFQKIQCFCFEEQRLLPNETIDMPVFFFIDPDIVNDPQVSYVRSITLSYTFFPTDIDDEENEEEVETKESNKLKAKVA